MYLLCPVFDDVGGGGGTAPCVFGPNVSFVFYILLFLGVPLSSPNHHILLFKHNKLFFGFCKKTKHLFYIHYECMLR